MSQTKIQKTIKEAISLFNQIAENSSDIITIFDLDFNVLYVNPAIYKLRGFTVEEAKVQKLNEILTPESLQKALSIFKEEIETEKERKADPRRSRLLELEHYRKDRSTIWLEIQVSFIRDKKNNPVAILVISRDISHRKEIEGMLRKSEEWYRTLFETSPDPIVIYDFKGNIINANRKTCDLYGVDTVDELIMSVSNVFHLLNDDDKQKARASISRVIQTGHSSGNEYCAQNKRGEKIFIEVHSSTLPDATGKPQAFVSILRDITTRKLMEEAIRESEQKYKTLFNNAEETILVVQDGIIKMLNPATEKMSGFSRDELTAKPFIEFIHLDDREMVLERYQSRIRGEEVESRYSFRILTKEGKVRWIELNVVRIEWEGKPALLNFITDITDRKIAEEHLLSSEAKFRTLFEAANDAIFIMDQSMFIDCNLKTLEMFGCTRDQIIGASPYQFSPEFQPDGSNSKEIALEKIHMALQGTPLFFEWKHCKYDGTAFDAEVSLKAFELGGKKYVQAIVRDITERKKSENLLRKSEEQYRILVETAIEGIWKIENHITTYANKAMANMLGYTPEEMLGKSIYDFMFEEDIPDLEERLKKRAKGIDEVYESRRKKKDGSELWAIISAKAIMDASGRYVGSFALYTDITQKRQNEIALLESEQKFREIFNSTNEAIFIHDPDSGTIKDVKDVNDAMLNLYGFASKEQVLSGKIIDLSANIPPYTEEETLRRVKKTMQEGSQTFEWLARKKNGEIFWAEISLKKAQLGGKNRIIAVVRDISERKKNEQHLKESEERYRNLAETTKDVIILHNMNGIIQYINQAGLAITGYSYNEIIGVNILNFIPKEYRKTVYKHHKKRLNGYTGIHEFDLELLDCAHKRIPIHVTSTPIIKDGRIEAIMVVVHDERERKKAEELLRANKQRLESIISVLQYEAKTSKELFQHILDEAIGITGSKIGFALNYDSKQKLFRRATWSKDAMAECAIVDIPETYHLETAGIWAETVRQKKPIIINDYDAEFPLKKGYPEGHVKIIRYLGIPIFKNQDIIATVGVANKESDYTEIDVLQLTLLMDAAWKSIERMQILEALQESEEKFRTLANSSPTAIMMFQDDKFVYINPEAEKMSGYSALESTTMNFWSIVHPDDMETIITRGKKRQSEKSADTSIEFRIIARDGTIKWVYLTASSVIFGGKPAALATAVDISARKKAQDALLEEKEKLRVTLLSIGDGVIATDTDGKILLINNAAEKLTGWKQDEAEGKHLSEIFIIQHETADKPLDNPVEMVLKTGVRYELSNHTILIAKDGTRRIIEDSAAPIMDSAGKIVGVVLVFRDMTEKIHLMEQAQRAERLEAIGVLAGGIAHDFNNILEGVFGYLGLAAVDVKDEHVSNMLAEALKSIQRAKGLTSQLLTFARGGEPVKKNQSLVPVVRDSVQFALSGSNVRAKFHFADDLLNAEFDFNQISQVIENITLNALQAMPQGGTITVSCNNFYFNENDRSLPRGNFVKISITDEGIGIPNELLPKIFDPFFTTKNRGHGLGLATSYSIILRHQGTIEVESEPGKGTTFHIYLPAAPVMHEAKTPPTKAKRLAGGKILILDDETIMQDIMVKFLKHLGFSAMVAGEGKEAIELFRRERNTEAPFDALIFDMTIKGGMSGKDTIREIRKIDPSIPAFVMSGYSEDLALSHPEQFGFNGSLSKPFKIEELEELLARFFAIE